jgi:hypothetical protein
MDRRYGPRFNLNVQVSFVWKPRGAESQSGEGETRDVSGRGLFVFTDACFPPVGTSVRLSMVLPSTDGGPGLVMRSKATVVRVESGEGSASGKGFAAVTKRYLIERELPTNLMTGSRIAQISCAKGEQ